MDKKKIAIQKMNRVWKNSSDTDITAQSIIVPMIRDIFENIGKDPNELTPEKVSFVKERS